MYSCLAPQGSIDMVMENVFQDCKVSMFANGIQAPVLIAETPAISFIDLNAPLRGHLARTLSNTEMMVVWSTKDVSTKSRVKWAYQQNGPYIYESNPHATITKSYNRDDMCGEPATSHGWSPSFYWHQAIISGLDPHSPRIVYYIYGSEENGWSTEESFKTLPASGPASGNVNIALVADMGMSEYDATALTRLNMPSAGVTAQAIANLLRSGTGYDYSLLVHVGDLAYSCGYLAKWETYMNKVTSTGLGTRVPYMINQGNHERNFPESGEGNSLYQSSYDSGGECGVATELRFPPPTNSSYADAGWYDFIQGPALVIMLNSEARVDPDSAQYMYLEETLKEADRLITPWIFIFSHRPMYYVYSKGGKIDSVYQVLEPLILRYQVDFFIQGHVHNTYLSCPVYNGTCITAAYEGGYTAPIHMGIGNAGVTPLDVVGNDTNTPSWVEYQASEYGFAGIRCNVTSIDVTYYNNNTESRHTLHVWREYPRRQII
jgi:acid phosphatase type 7